MNEKLMFWVTMRDGTRHQVEPEFFRFPAGEWQMMPIQMLLFPDGFELDHSEVLLRSTDMDDIIKVGLWASYVRKTFEATQTLYVPYLPASRSDKGDTMAVNVYNSILTAFKFDEIITVDAHSALSMCDLVWGSNNMSSVPLTLAAVAMDTVWENYVGVIAPDEGARKRAARVAAALGVPLYVCEKVRDTDTGEIITYALPEGIIPISGRRMLVVDDICDGGSTFIHLADSLNYVGLDLWVTHGIFSKGTDELQERYGSIFTTNSVVHPEDVLEDVYEIDLMPYMRCASNMIKIGE